jgi:hypothetical protein
MGRSLTCVPLQLFIYLKGNSPQKRFQSLTCSYATHGTSDSPSGSSVFWPVVSKVRHAKRAAPLSLYADDLICRALLTSELQSIFADAPQAPSSLAHDNVREAYARAAGKAPELTPADSRRRIPGPEDSCPICYECMHGVSQDKLVFCEECGNALHTECFGQCSLFTAPFLSITLSILSPVLTCRAPMCCSVDLCLVPREMAKQRQEWRCCKSNF